MRNARFLADQDRRLLGVVLAGGLAFMCLGCHQHYYYYGDPCAPGTPMPSTVRTGPVCDVPTQVVEGGTKLSDGSSSRSTTVSGGSPSRSSRVVVSEPSEPSRLSWRRSDPDGSLATTTVQGGTVNDSAVNR